MGCKSLAHRCLLSSGRLGLLPCHTLLCMAVRQGSARGSTALKPADTHNQDLLSLSPEDFRTQLALAAPLPTPTQLLGDPVPPFLTQQVVWVASALMEECPLARWEGHKQGH